MKPLIEQPTKKRIGHIVMTSTGYVRRTPKGFIPYDPQTWKRQKK